MFFQYAGVTTGAGCFGALAERGRGRGLHLMRTVAAGANRREAVLRVQQRLRMYATQIGGVNLTVAVLARRLFERCRRAFYDRVRVVAVDAHRRVWIAPAHHRSVDAVLPFIELVGMTVAANLRHFGREAARASDFFFLRRMRCEITIGM